MTFHCFWNKEHPQHNQKVMCDMIIYTSAATCIPHVIFSLSSSHIDFLPVPQMPMLPLTTGYQHRLFLLLNLFPFPSSQLLCIHASLKKFPHHLSLLYCLTIPGTSPYRICHSCSSCSFNFTCMLIQITQVSSGIVYEWQFYCGQSSCVVLQLTYHLYLEPC